MKLSTREVFQLAERCFRSAGLSLGTARSTSKAIWWTEVTKGTGITTLHNIIEEYPEIDRQKLELQNQQSSFATVLNNGLPSIVSSKPSLDLSNTKANETGIGIVHTSVPSVDTGLTAIGHSAYRAAERGLICILIYYDDERGTVTTIGNPGSPHPMVAEIELDTWPRAYNRLYQNIQSDYYSGKNNLLYHEFFENDRSDTHRTADLCMVNRLLQESIEPDQTAGDSLKQGFITICIDPVHPTMSNGLQNTIGTFINNHRSTITNIFSPQYTKNRGSKLLENGVAVEKEIWKDLFEFSNGIFSPDSEGSGRAGPGLEG